MSKNYVWRWGGGGIWKTFAPLKNILGPPCSIHNECNLTGCRRKNTKSMGFLRSWSSAIFIVLIVRVFLEFYKKKIISGFLTNSFLFIYPWKFHQLRRQDRLTVSYETCSKAFFCQFMSELPITSKNGQSPILLFVHRRHYGNVKAQADHPLLVGAVVDWNLSNDLLLFIEEIHMNNTAAIICSKMQNLKQIFR